MLIGSMDTCLSCVDTNPAILLVRGKTLYGMRPVPVSTQVLVENDHGGVGFHEYSTFFYVHLTLGDV